MLRHLSRMLLQVIMWVACCSSEGALCQCAEWMGSFRAAAPGAWSLAGAGRIGMGGPNRAGCLAMLGGAGLDRLAIDVAVPLNGTTSWGGGMDWRKGGVISAVLSASRQGMAGRISVPVVQPAAHPHAPTWWFGAEVPFGSCCPGRITLQWTPGGWPRLTLMAWGKVFHCGTGSDGAWVGWTAPTASHQPAITVHLGILRGDIPWSGLDVGDHNGLGSDPWHWLPNQWLR